MAKTKRTRTVTVEHRSISPTPERLAKADGHFTVGDDKQGGKVYTFADDVLERALKRKAISPEQFAALDKFRHHWFHAGLLPSIGGVDLNRVFSSDPGSISGMAKSERQVFHRQQYRKAVQVIGLRLSSVVERIACRDEKIDAVGHSLGWSHPLQARAAATEMLVTAADLLGGLWKGAK